MCGCGCNGQPAGAKETVYQYSSKLLCGALKTDKNNALLTTGVYKTLVNVHNPSKCDSVEFRWKVAPATPLGSELKPFSDFFDITLGPDQAMFIDCASALRMAKLGTPTFFDGWLVIEAQAEVDVVATYTLESTLDPSSRDIEVERIPARCVPDCKDLWMPLSTGNVAWQILDNAGNHLGLATLGKAPGTSAAWGDLPHSLWIRDPSMPEKESTREFEVCFDLCAGFKEPLVTTLQVLADGHALVTINGNTLPGGFLTATHPWHTNPTDPGTTPAILTVPKSMLRAGRNCVRVKLYNKSGPAGFCISGGLEIPKGACPGFVPPLIPCPTVEYQAYCHKRALSIFNIQDGYYTNTASGTAVGCDRGISAMMVRLVNAPPGTSVHYELSGDANWPDPANSGNFSGSGSDGTWVGLTGNASKNRVAEKIKVWIENLPVHCPRLRYVVWGNGKRCHGQQFGVEGVEVGETNCAIDSLQMYF